MTKYRQNKAHAYCAPVERSRHAAKSFPSPGITPKQLTTQEHNPSIVGEETVREDSRTRRRSMTLLNLERCAWTESAQNALLGWRRRALNPAFQPILGKHHPTKLSGVMKNTLGSSWTGQLGLRVEDMPMFLWGPLRLVRTYSPEQAGMESLK
jgi:hypothetical protein